MLVMLEYILEMHTSSQATQMQGAQRFGLLGNGDGLGEGSDHPTISGICSLTVDSCLSPGSEFHSLWKKPPVPLHVILADIFP